jgi:glutathione S-transferase/RNA polymerase-associated protein
MMKLFDNPLSPYAMKVRGILYEKGIEFENHEILTKSQLEELRRLNPRAEVPALVDGRTTLYDSKVIAEYLEERYPSPALLPADPDARAKCRALELLSDTEVDAAVLAFSLFKFFRTELIDSHPGAFKKAEAGVRGHFAALDRRLQGREYFLGAFSRADIALAPHVGACAFLGLAPGADTPALAAWLARMNERPSVQRTTREAMASLALKTDEPAFDTKRLHWRGDRLEQLVRIGMGAWLLEELAADRAFLPPAP